MQTFTAASHHDVLGLLVQVTILLLSARLLAELAQRFAQPAVVGEILAGIVLGPSLLSGLFPVLGQWIVPHTPEQGHLLEVVALIGALFLLLITGLETDVALIRRHARLAMGASLGGIVVPFATGFLLGQYLPDSLLADPAQRLVFSLFVATAMSISAIPVIAKVLMDLNLMRRDIGQTIIAAGMTDDAIGWMLLSVVLGLAAHGEITAGGLLWSVGKVLGFMLLSFTLGRWLVRRALDYTQDRLVSSTRMLTLVVGLMFAWGALTQALNLEAVFGAFVIGILFGQMPRLPAATRHTLEWMALGVFAPIFFAVAGLKVNARALLEPQLALIALVVIAVATLGKVVGGYVGARYLGKSDHWSALAFGAGMNARGAMEIIIATIGLSLGILTQDMFSVIVVMAITTSLMAPPALRWVLQRVVPSEQELRRLEREELAARSLVAGVRRVLMPVRCREEERRAILRLEGELLEQLNSRSRLAATLLCVVPPEDDGRASGFLDRAAERFSGLDLSRKVVYHGDPTSVILDEAQKDYDLLIVGASEKPRAGGDLFTSRIDTLLRLAPCPTMVVKGRIGEYNWPPKRVLVPTNGSQAARHAADLAFALCEGDPEREVMLLNVVSEASERHRVDPSGASFERQLGVARALVDELCKVGETQGVRTRAEVRVGASPETVILDVAERHGVDLVVVGTDLRPASDRVFLGPRVERILNSVPCPVVVLNAR